MKQKIKILALMLSLLICLSVFSITAYADNEDDLYSSDVNSDVSQVVPDNNDQPADTVPNESNGQDTDTNYNSGSDNSVSDNYSNYDSSNSYSNYADNSNDSYTDYNNSNSYNEYNDYNNYEFENNNSGYDTNSNVNSYNENNTNEYNSGYLQQPSEADLYKTDGMVDNDELSDSDWNSIAQSLQNANDSGDGDDFNFIKKNNSSSDNGIWMLISGALLIILAIVGIAYVIISGMNNKKKFAYGNGYNTFNSNSSRKPKNYYNDGFSKTKSKPKNSISRKHIDDTADIILPKNKKR